MVQTYFAETFVKGKDNILNSIRHKKIRDLHLITTDHGAWVALEETEYKQLIKNELSNELYKILEEKGIIITKNNTENIIKDYKKRYDYLLNGTSLHILIPTLRCNQKCIYCHSSAKNSKSKENDMDQETAKKILEFIFQTPSKSITIEFQGGDTLLTPLIFRYVVLEAKKMNKIFNKKIRYALVTNLTLMNEEIAEFICKEDVDLCTSLDGPKYIHDKNRIMEENKPTYDEVVKWIKIIQQKYNKKIAALMVTTKYSLPHWKEIVDEYVKRGMNSLQIKYINKIGYAEKEWKDIGYTIEEFLDFWKNSVDYMIELNKKGEYIKERFVVLILQKILNKHDPNFLDFRNPCGIVTGQMAYNYNGDIYSCDEGRNNEMFKLGNVKNNSYKEITTSTKSQQLINSSINDNLLCDACIYKTYCGTCPVINYAEDGNLIPKLPKNSKCKIQKYQFDYVFEKILFGTEEEKKILFSWLEPPQQNQHLHKN